MTAPAPKPKEPSTPQTFGDGCGFLVIGVIMFVGGWLLLTYVQFDGVTFRGFYFPLLGGPVIAAVGVFVMLRAMFRALFGRGRH